MKKNFFPEPGKQLRHINNFLLFQKSTKVYKELQIVSLNNATLTIESPDVIKITSNDRGALIMINRGDGLVDCWEYSDGIWYLNDEPQ